MLEHYVKAKGWNIFDVYVDDGYTGLNTNRPSFQRMIKDVEDKRLILSLPKTYQGLEETIFRQATTPKPFSLKTA